MSAATWLVALTAAALAYANGANDVSKAIAPLVGSRVSDARRALLWGAWWTGVGAAPGAVGWVALATRRGLPVSTTHVAAGGIAGKGVRRGSVNLAAARSIALAWLVTLPLAACLGAGLYLAVTALGA